MYRKNDQNSNIQVQGSLRHGADIVKVVMSCGAGCIFMAVAPELEKHIATTRVNVENRSACNETVGDTAEFFYCGAVRLGGFCDAPLFGIFGLDVGCDATCSKCKLLYPRTFEKTKRLDTADNSFMDLANYKLFHPTPQTSAITRIPTF
jgi:hypothetical protein